MRKFITLTFFIICHCIFSIGQTMPDNVDTIADCVGVPEATSFTMRKAFSSTQGVNSYIAPVIGDIDGDRKPEIFAVVSMGHDDSAQIPGSYYLFDKIAIFKGNNRDNPTFINCEVGRNISVSALALAKIKINNVDKFLIFMVSAISGKIVAYDATTGSSTPVWKSNQPVTPPLNQYTDPLYQIMDSVYATSINLADFNNDGYPEIYCGGKIFDATTGILLCQIPQGGKEGKSTYNQFTSQFSSIVRQLTVAADVVGDRKLELCAGTQVYSVNINSRNNINQNSMTLVAELPEDPSKYWVKDGKTIVADIDQDGQLDVIVSDMNYNSIQIIVWNPRNNTLIAKGGIPWNQPENYPFISVPLVGNIDSNPDVEIVQISDQQITAYRINRITKNLDVVYTKSVVDPSGGTGITLFDFNQDKVMEIIYRDETRLRVMSANSQNNSFSTKTWYQSYAGTGFEHPIIADVDDDGEVEIIALGGENTDINVDRSNGKLKIYKSNGNKWAPGRRVWNQYAYNAININEDLSIPRYQFNPGSFFAGIDQVMGTADDIQPFNSFLQQQTFLDKYGEPFWALPIPKDTIYDTICHGDTYQFYGRTISDSGKYQHTIIVEDACDTLRTLFLHTVDYFRKNIVEEICQGETYVLGSRVINTTGIYQDTIISSDGCDSIITLNLKVLENSAYEYKDTSYKCEYYHFGNDSLNNTGIYVDTVTASNGCDSIVTLDLLVRPKEFDDSIKLCVGQLPITVYDTTFAINSVTGIYKIKHRCATITFHLEVMPELSTLDPEIPEICADANNFTVKIPTNLKSNTKAPTNYTVNFDNKAINAGFSKLQGDFEGGEDIIFDLPEGIRPDYYNCTISLYDSVYNCSSLEYNITFPVLYSKDIIEQMWNDVIALLNDRYNGGYKFSAYEWYEDGNIIPNENKSYIYIPNGKWLDFNGKYQALPTRSDDGVKIFTCPLIPKQHSDLTTYPTVVNRSTYFQIAPQKNLKVEIYNVTGVLISSHYINGKEINPILSPSQSGIYILLFYENDNNVSTGKIIVK